MDGRTRPQSEPRAKIDWLKKGQWVTIQCQVSGELAYGSRIWDKVGGYFVPDQFIKTYTDGFLSGAPRCGVPPAETPATPPIGTTRCRPAGDPTNTTPPPAPTPGAGCTAKTVRVGPLTATASCFRRDGKAYVASGQVRVAGVDVRTTGAGAEVRIEPAALEISTTGQTQVSVGNLVLYRRPLEWRVGRQFAFSVERGVKLRGLPVTGSATFDVDAAQAARCSSASTSQLPGVLGGVSGATVVRASADGVAVDDITVTAGSARLGRFELRDLALAYSDAEGIPHFEGQGTLVLPSPLSPTVTARLGFGVGDGYFHAGGEVARTSTARWPTACSCSASASTSRSTRSGSAAASASAPGRASSGPRRSRSTGTSRTRTATRTATRSTAARGSSTSRWRPARSPTRPTGAST